VNVQIDWKDCPLVEAAQGRMAGRPVVRDSRVLADTILECAELGETPQEIAEDYRLPLNDVEKLLVYAALHSEPATVP
jgi:uncharacterized protein (DUF433 family)